MKITIAEAAQELLHHDHITILCHRRPDGDTLGSGFGLWYALCSLGKTTRVLCSDGLPENYAFLAPGYLPGVFEEEYVVAADVATEELLGDLEEVYRGRVDLCVDHHPTNTHFAQKLLLDPTAAATAELMQRLIEEMGVPLSGDSPAARCLYTGIATDTGCFRFSNTTPRCLRIAAAFIDSGLDTRPIHTALFESKSPAQVALEAQVLGNIQYFFNGRCAVIIVPKALQEELELDDARLEGLAALPREVQGVWVGVTIKEKNGHCRISIRTTQEADAAAICASFGGGGHLRAAGCTIAASPEHAKALLLEKIGQALEIQKP